MFLWVAISSTAVAGGCFPPEGGLRNNADQGSDLMFGLPCPVWLVPLQGPQVDVCLPLSSDTAVTYALSAPSPVTESQLWAFAHGFTR